MQSRSTKCRCLDEGIHRSPRFIDSSNLQPLQHNIGQVSLEAPVNATQLSSEDAYKMESTSGSSANLQKASEICSSHAHLNHWPEDFVDFNTDFNYSCTNGAETGWIANFDAELNFRNPTG